MFCGRGATVGPGGAAAGPRGDCFLAGLPEELRGDRTFLLRGASDVVEDGAASFASLDAVLLADRELTAAYISRNPDCLQHSRFLDDAELVGLAVSASKGACLRNLDLATPRVRTCRSVLEQAAAAGADRFYKRSPDGSMSMTSTWHA